MMPAAHTSKDKNGSRMLLMLIAPILMGRNYLSDSKV
jgi:hypothetical protein